MTLFKRIICSAALAGGFLLPAHRLWAEPLVAPATQPSVDPVQALIDRRDYVGAVKLSSRLLQLRGAAAAGLDRFQLTLLKGEAQIGTKSVSTGIMTMKSAEKETKDPTEIIQGKWTTELFRTAGGLSYSPRPNPAGQKRGPFDLTDAGQLKDAFGALLDDSISAMEPRLKAATVSQRLPQIWPVLQQVEGLAELDRLANSNDDKTSTLASSLLDHSRNLLSNALKGMWARVNDIDSHANIVTNVPTELILNGQLMEQTVSKKNGLSDSNRRELSETIDTCRQIHDAAEAFMPLTKSDKDWGTILNDADRTAGKAADVAAADYGQATSSSMTQTSSPLVTPHR